jgi:hypothetical protein
LAGQPSESLSVVLRKKWNDFRGGIASMTNYLDYYSTNLEGYLSGPVRSGFQRNGYLPAEDFFCIVIRKASRAKSKVAKRLLHSSNSDTLDEAVRKLTEEISNGGTPEAKMRVLIEKWGFRLPMASAILTILYPEEFTVYDVRVVDALDEESQKELGSIDNRAAVQSLWSGYLEYVNRVKKSAPSELCLRDKDKWLWGQSFLVQLQKNIRENFSKANSDED